MSLNNNTIRWSFSVRKDRPRVKDSKVPIYIIFYENGKLAKQLSTGYFIHLDDWDKKKQRIDHRSSDHLINDLLSDYSLKLRRNLHKLELEGIVNVSMLLESLNPNKQIPNLLSLFTEHNTDMKSRVGNDFTISTLKKYETTQKHLKKYLNSKSYDDIPLKRVDVNFLWDFKDFLNKNGCSQNTSLKYLTHLRKIILLGQRRGYIEFNPFRDFVFRYEEKSPKFLTLNEVKRIETKSFEIERVENVRQLFLFACYTGLSFSDLQRLEQEHINTDADGDKYILIQRMKTGVTCMIPLSKKAINIIDVNTLEEKLLPSISNQKMNAYLNEIADLCGIKKKLTSHVARHTFATSLISKGVSMETVGKLLGHKRISSTQKYAKVTSVKIKIELKRANIL